MRKIICVLLLAALLLTGCAGGDYSNVLKANWGFSLPEQAGYREVYSQESEASFTGDGFRYHVFSCENSDAIGTMRPWSDTPGQTRFWGTYPEAVEKWLDEIAVPQDQRPGAGPFSYWYDVQEDGSEIILLWDRDGGRLYVAECFL